MPIHVPCLLQLLETSAWYVACWHVHISHGHVSVLGLSDPQLQHSKTFSVAFLDGAL